MNPKLLTIFLVSSFSVILWVFVSFSYDYTTTFTVPLEFVNIKEGHALLSQSNSDISITIKGQGWSLAQITFGPETTFKISTNDKIGIQNYNIRASIGQNTWLNSSLQVVMISPEEVSCAIERLSYKKVPIVDNVSIGLEAGYGLVSKVRLIPDSVKISGPKSLIHVLKSIETERVEFDNSNENISTKLNLKPIKYVNFENNKTIIEFDVQKIVDKTFKNVKVKVVNVPNLRDLDLFPPAIDVTLRGGLQNLGIQTSDDITAVVDFNDAFRDTIGFVKPKITIPEFSTLINAQPNTLNYIIKQY
jgi:hypothetical protein